MSLVACVEVDDGQHVRCFSPPELAIHEGDLCVIEGDRLVDFGRITKLQEDGSSSEGKGMPRLARRATLQDQAKASENAIMSKMAMKSCAAAAKKLNMAIHLVRVRYTFDRAVLRVLFASEDDVDGRSLQKEIEGELHTRIDLQQIGVRDEAGLIGGVGPCGRALCCCTWLHHFESVNVKMAKIQNLSLNPAAISGNCGRLKCCLRYENELYRSMGRNMPRQGAVVETPDGQGFVVGKDILSQRLRVRLEDERLMEYSMDEVREKSNPHNNGRSRRSDDEDPGSERSQSESAGDEGA